MNKVITFVVPHSVGAQLKGVTMTGLAIVQSGVAPLIAATAHVPANETYPEGVDGLGDFSALLALRTGGLFGALHAATNGARRVAPLLETVRVERVVAQDCQDSVDGLVHSF
jgi:hypothetical protein